MKNKVLTIIGIIMLICIVTLGFFAFPVGIPLCAVIGLIYGTRGKNKSFIKWSSLALIIGVVLIVYTLLLTDSM